MFFKSGHIGGNSSIPPNQNQTERVDPNQKLDTCIQCCYDQGHIDQSHQNSKRKRSPIPNLISNIGSIKSSHQDFQRSPQAFSSNNNFNFQDPSNQKKQFEIKSNQRFKGQLGSPGTKFQASRGQNQVNKYTTPQFSMQASTGSICPHHSGAPSQSQKFNMDVINQKWPHYLNTLKNIEVSEPGSQLQYPSSGYSSQPSIKQSIVGAKKTNITGVFKGFPGRAQFAQGSSYQNLPQRKQPAKPDVKLSNRGTKQLRSDSPRNTQQKFKLSSRELMGKQFMYQTHTSIYSCDRSVSPNNLDDHQGHDGANSNFKQNSKVATMGRVSRASDCKQSQTTQMTAFKTKVDLRGPFTNTRTSRAQRNQFNSPSDDESNNLQGPRPFNKPPLTHIVAPKTQNPSIRNSPKIEVRKAIYVATDGADAQYNLESVNSTQFLSQNKKDSRIKSPTNSKLKQSNQPNFKQRFQGGLQPHRHSRNQSKLAIGSNRQNSKLNLNNSSYGLSSNLTKITSGGLNLASQALKSSPSLWTGHNLEEEKKKIIKVTAQIPDPTIPTATLHLQVGQANTSRVQAQIGNSKQREQYADQQTRKNNTIYGIVNPRRPSAGLQMNSHQRKNTLEFKDSRRASNQENMKSSMKNKFSPRSNKSRDFSKKRASPAPANCLSDKSAKSSNSKTSNQIQQRIIQPKKQNINQPLKQNKKKIQHQEQLRNSKERYSLQTSPNLQIGVSALRESNSKFDRKSGRLQTHKINNLSINRLRSYSPRVNLSQLQNIQQSQDGKEEDQVEDTLQINKVGSKVPVSQYLHLTGTSSAFNTVIVNSARNNKIDLKKGNISDFKDTMTHKQVQGTQSITKIGHIKKKDSTHIQSNFYSGSRSPPRRGVNVTNTTVGHGSQANTSRFFTSQGTSEGKGKRSKRRDQSATSGMFSPRSKANNDSNIAKSSKTDKTNTDNNSQIKSNNQNKTPKSSVQVSRVFLNLVESLLQNIQTQLNPRQTKDFERNFQNTMTSNAKEIDPYLKVKCFQLSRPNWISEEQNDEKIVERGNILHFLSASGYFPVILDFILRKKCQAKHSLDKNEMTVAIKDGSEKNGHTALHLACLSLRQKSIEKLLLSRVNVNIASGDDEDTPIHVLIKMFNHQSMSLSQQKEDLGADMDLEDIRECIQLILPFCEESLNKKNIQGQTPYDLIVQNNLQTLSLIVNEQYPGFIDDGQRNSSPLSKLSSPRNVEMDYIEVNADELDEFSQQDKTPFQKSNLTNHAWKTNSKLKESEQIMNGTPPRTEMNNQILKNYLEKKANQPLKQITAEGLSSSAQQAQRKESTKSYKETSRKYELSEIEEKESPLEEQVDKKQKNKDIRIEAVKITYLDTPGKRKKQEQAPSNSNNSANPPLQIDFQQNQQSQSSLQKSIEQRQTIQGLNSDQCGEQSAEAQDRHSGLAFTPNNEIIPSVSQLPQLFRNNQNFRYQNEINQIQTGGYRDRQSKYNHQNIQREINHTAEDIVKQSTNLSPNNDPNHISSDQDKSKSLRRQSREDELSAKKKKQTNNQNSKKTNTTNNQREIFQIKNKKADQPDNLSDSNGSKQNDQIQEIENRRQNNRQKQGQMHQNNQLNTIIHNEKNDQLLVQTIFNVDTPERAFKIHLNDNISESMINYPESAVPGTAGASAVDFDNVSSLKQNIQRMQLSEFCQSVQSGADSRVSRRSQRPLKMANKKVVRGESFGNDIDESDQKHGKLMRMPPNLNPNPSQPNQQSDNSYLQNKYTSKDSEDEKLNKRQNKLELENEIGPHSFLTHQLLGTGSFGEVFLVEEISTGKLMAMKVLSKQKAREQKLLKYNFAEKEIMARMTKADHPFVVKLYYTFQTTESLFMVMEFCAGGDLSQYLEVEGCFNETKAKQYICEIICAIEALHENNIIFRDLKPDNIVLDSEGHAMLVDFGLSRQNVKGTSTGADSFCGSYAYLAPEMIKKKGHGKAVDWYLIGVVLYELLTGMPPFYDDDKEILFKNITNKKLEFPPDEELPLTRVCKDFIGQLLHKDPSKRLGIQNGIKDIKAHAFFAGVDWRKVEKKKYRQPEAYLAEMALSIIKKDPYALKDHPRTKGKLSSKGDTNHLDGWEVNLVKDFQVQVKAPIINKL